MIQARRQFEGYIDQIDNKMVYGWRRQIGTNKTVVLDLLVDDEVAISVNTNLLQAGLAAAGFEVGARL